MSRLSLKNDFKDGEVLYGAQLNTNNNATVEAVNDNYERIMNLQDLKADIVDVNDNLATKVDTSTFNDSINSINTTKADKSEVALKADKTELETKADKTELQQGLSTKADTTYVNNQLSIKANKSDVDASLALKADKSDTYTKDETTSIINSAVSIKADKTELNNKANKSELGDLSNLLTTDKSSAVAAINELKQEGSEVSNIDNLSINKNSNGAIQTIGVIDRNDEEVSIKTWTGTKDEYDALETKNANTLYYIIDDDDEHELVSNKVTTINSDSTDKQYPSAKAVYDSIQGLTPGGGGTTNYNDLDNQPQINGVTLVGNKSSADLGIKQTYTADDIAFDDGETFQQKYDAGELTGPQGPQGNPGAAGETGPAGANATINGQNAINLLAGDNINITQEDSNVTISSTASGGGATYTAGTNIEITEDNVINSTISYSQKTLPQTEQYILLGREVFNRAMENCIGIGFNLNIVDKYNVAIGHVASANSYSISIGYNSGGISSNKSVTIGYSAMNEHSGSILFGYRSSTDKDNQFVLGSTYSPINEMKVVTSAGDKYIATTDQTVPAGGTTGQVLMKNSDTDYDFGWSSLTDYDEVSF